jgi:predicted transposase YdaD
MSAEKASLDLNFKYLARNYSEDFLKLVLNSSEPLKIHHEDKELNIPQLRADNIYIVEQGTKRFALHLEFQLEHRKELPQRMFLYNALIEASLRLPTYSVIIYLERKRQLPPPNAYQKIQFNLSHTFTYSVVRLWEHLPRIRKDELPGLAPTLMLLTEKKSLDVYRETKALIKKLEADPEKRDAQLAIAASVAGRYLDISKLPKEDIQMLQILDQILLSGKNSVTEYLLNEKRKEGIREGKIEGKIEGEQEAKQDFIMAALQERFGESMDGNIMAQIKQIRDAQTLNDLFRTSLRAESLDEFKKTLYQRNGISFRS